ncbi:MAG: hypothetical protein KME04_03335 [Pleurocapsa minor GSE-CHR-MK-17-07R]|jgi:hypothetical protein|nr:hypothetical protein [Pleurocapsa minor GSE-CHR-MK 17-07R]
MKRKSLLTPVAVSTVAAVVVVAFAASLVTDPIVNYYGVRMRQSQYVALLSDRWTVDQNFGAYCYAYPITNLAEQSVCFDTEAELNHYSDRQSAVERALRGE